MADKAMKGVDGTPGNNLIVEDMMGKVVDALKLVQQRRGGLEDRCKVQATYAVFHQRHQS